MFCDAQFKKNHTNYEFKIRQDYVGLGRDRLVSVPRLKSHWLYGTPKVYVHF